MQVLVADDDPIYRKLLQTLLEKWHFDVVTASDGAEAWEILQGDDPPRLVILDWMMPQMDGFQVCQQVRKGRHNQSTFILLMTANRDTGDIMKVLVAGADDYLLKPFDTTDLQIHIRTATRILNLQEELEKLQAPMSSAAK